MFRRFSRAAANTVGHHAAFFLGVFLLLVWAFSGPYFHYSPGWQTVLGTGASVGAFLIVFLIQNTQNHDAKVMNLKLDDLIRAVKTARTELVQMEGLTDDELEHLQQEFQAHRDRSIRNQHPERSAPGVGGDTH